MRHCYNSGLERSDTAGITARCASMPTDLKVSSGLLQVQKRVAEEVRSRCWWRLWAHARHPHAACTGPTSPVTRPGMPARLHRQHRHVFMTCMLYMRASSPDIGLPCTGGSTCTMTNTPGHAIAQQLAVFACLQISFV